MGMAQGSQENIYILISKKKKTLKSTFYPCLHRLYLTNANVP